MASKVIGIGKNVQMREAEEEIMRRIRVSKEMLERTKDRKKANNDDPLDLRKGLRKLIAKEIMVNTLRNVAIVYLTEQCRAISDEIME